MKATANSIKINASGVEIPAGSLIIASTETHVTVRASGKKYAVPKSVVKVTSATAIRSGTLDVSNLSMPLRQALENLIQLDMLRHISVHDTSDGYSSIEIGVKPRGNSDGFDSLMLRSLAAVLANLEDLTKDTLSEGTGDPIEARVYFFVEEAAAFIIEGATDDLKEISLAKSKTRVSPPLVG